MALAFTNLGASATPDLKAGNDATSYSTGSWTPPSSGLIIAFVNSAVGTTTAVEPTMSGNGLTWVKIASHVAEPSGNALRITLFAANASGSSAGVTTIDFGSETQLNCDVSFFQVDNADLSGGVAAAFVQTPTGNGTGTSGSVTLSAAGNSNNRPIVAFNHAANEVTNPRANWTEVDEHSGSGPTRSFETQWRSDAFETTASATWTSSVNWVGLAAEIKAAGAGSYTMAAGAGSFSLSGQNSTLRHGYKAVTTAGSFSLTGNNSTLRWARKLHPAAGSYSMSGQAATLRHSYKVVGAPGTFTLLGISVLLRQAHKLSGAPGAFVLSGSDAFLRHGYRVGGAPGIFVLTGSDTRLAVSRFLHAGVGSITLTGINANLTAARVYTLNPEPALFTLTGQPASLRAARRLPTGLGVFNLVGVDAFLRRSYALGALAGSFVLVGVDASLVYSPVTAYILPAGTGAFVLAGSPATLTYVPRIPSPVHTAVIYSEDNSVLGDPAAAVIRSDLRPPTAGDSDFVRSEQLSPTIYTEQL